jgi:hypothetical protein
LKLGLPKLKPTPYNLKMANQTTTKLVGLIRDLKIYVHDILYIIMFTTLHNSVVDFNYSMLLGRPWLRVAHDWGSNIVTIQGNGIVRTITVTKHLRNEIRRPKMLLYYEYHNGITNEEDIIFVTKPKLFSIGIINFPNKIQSMKTTDVEIMDTDVRISISKQGFRIQSTKKKILNNKYEPKVALEVKVCKEMYYRHQSRSVIVDEILAKIKA